MGFLHYTLGVLDDWCCAADQVEYGVVNAEDDGLGANQTISSARYVLSGDSECVFIASVAAVLCEDVRASSLEFERLAVERDVMTVSVGRAGGATYVVCADHATVSAFAGVAFLLDNRSFTDGLVLEAAWALEWLDALSCDGVENHTWDACATGWAATRRWASEVHVGAGWLAVGTLVPDLISWAHLVCHAIVFGAFPQSSVACACVALFFTDISGVVVSSLEGALAFSDSYTLVGFLVNGLTWQTVASGNALFNTSIWLNLATSLATALATLLVHLTSRAGNSALSTDSPVGNDLSGKSTVAGIGRESGTLAVGSTVGSGGACADVLFAHGDVVGWFDDWVATGERSLFKKGALFLGYLDYLGSAIGSNSCLALALCWCLPWLGELRDVLDVVSLDGQRIIFHVSIEITAQTGDLATMSAAELNFQCWLWIEEDRDTEWCCHLDEGGWHVTDDNSVFLVWQLDADVIDEDFVWKNSDHLSVRIFSDLKSNCLGADGAAVFAHLVLHPDWEWCINMGSLSLLDKNVFTLAGEVKGTSVECAVMWFSGDDATSGAFSGNAGPFSSGSAHAFLAFISVGGSDWVGDAVLSSVAAALFWNDALDSIEECTVWAEASVHTLGVAALSLEANRSAGTSAGFTAFHVYHAVSAFRCRAEGLWSPVCSNSAKHAGSRVLGGSFTDECGTGLHVSLSQTSTHVTHAESFEVGWADLGVALAEWTYWIGQFSADSLDSFQLGLSDGTACVFLLLDNGWNDSLVHWIDKVVSKGDVICKIWSGDGLEVIAIDAVVVTAHTADDVLHRRWGECEDCWLTVVQDFQLGDSCDEDVWSLLAHDQTLDRVGQLNRLAVHRDNVWGEHDLDVFNLNVDRSLTSVWLTAERVVYGHYVEGMFFAVLYHLVSSFSWVGKCLLIKGDIVFTSPRHAHGMITELVLINGGDFVDMDALSASGSHESLRAGAGVRCWALTTIHACSLADRLVAECASVSGLALTRCLFRDNNACSFVTTSAATIGYITSRSVISCTSTGTFVSDTDSAVKTSLLAAWFHKFGGGCCVGRNSC
jgi:hypothetical protein